MKKITRIESAKQLNFAKKLKVAAYARVSTDSEEQLLSLETQKAHYESYITSIDDWEFSGVYFDEGISGTKVAKRQGLLQMLKDAEEGKIDYIITKSISRFARNTTDCLEMVRKLAELGIAIYFEKENIDTSKMESEFLLTILSSMAETESISISQNQRWSIQKRFENGTYKITYPPYGYENIDGRMVIVPEQAEIVKRIFKEALSGMGTRAIARGLKEDGVPTKKGGSWTGGTINGMLTNEKYVGDVIYQKTFSDDHFVRRINYGERNMYLVENHHEAIITREQFDKVQLVLSRRAMEKGNVGDPTKYMSRYSLSGKIKCSKCGGVFKRRHHYKPSGDYIAWSCNTHIEDKSACDMLYITDDGVKAAFVTMMQKLSATHRQILKPFVEGLRGLKEKDMLLKVQEINDALEKIIDQKQVLVGLMTAGILEPAVFNQENNDLQNEEARLTLLKEQIAKGATQHIQQARDAEKLMKFVSGTVIEEFDDEAFTEHVEQILVLDREKVVFCLKCGLKFEERLVM